MDEAVPTINEITARFAISQTALSRLYGIPYRTLNNWSVDPSSPNYRKCPEYVRRLLVIALEAREKEQS